MPYEIVRLLNSDHPYRYDGTLFGGAKLWTPSEISTALWLDADSPSSITLNGATVSQWNDKSGNNRHATQPTAANQPTYLATGLNGKPVLSFNGTADGLVLPTGVGLPRDMVSVTSGYGFLYSSNNTTDRLAFQQTAGTNLFWNTAPGSPTGLTIPGRNNTGTFIEQFTAQGLTWEVFLNGASAASGSTTGAWTNNNSLTQIGLKWAAATTVPTWQGIIAEIIWTNSVMSVSDRQKTEGYLAWKWGLQANLPVSHPYYSAPPLV